MKKLLLFFIFLFPLINFSQQVVPIEQFLQFNGRYDFTAFGNTLNTDENAGPNGYCSILTESSADFQLQPGETLVSANLYWSGPGTGDLNVKLNGTSVTSQRTFTLTALSGITYFAAYADVTNIVALNGAGTYTLSDLDLNAAINADSAICAQATNYGGWSIIIVYEDPSLLLNQITLFDGLDYVDSNHNNINIILDNISAATDVASKIGFLAWEGDLGIAIDESLRLNGILIDNPPLNPGNNAFNGTNSYTNSDVLYNMDLDYYDLQGLNIIDPGDDQIDIQLSSGQDFIMVNNIIVGVNSELPDATITIDKLGVLCQDRNIEVNYTVSNINSTAVLPAKTQIAFYVDNNLVGQAQTVNELPIDGTESGIINLNIPNGTPQIFTFKLVVDDDGAGNGSVLETNEDNNIAEEQIDLSEQGLSIVGPEQSCEGQTEILTANFTDLDNYNWFFDGNPYGGNTSSIEVTQSGNYSVSGNKAACFVDESPAFTITFNPQPVANPAVDLFRCDDGIQTGFFDLTQNDANVLGGQDPALFEVKYFTNVFDSNNNTNAITTPGAYPIAGPSPQTIYVRIHDRAQQLCYALTKFKIYYTLVDAGDVPPFSLCDQDESGGEDVNLTLEFNDFVLNGQNPDDYNISYHDNPGDASTGDNPLPNIYNVPVPGQTIYIRIEPVIFTDCYDTTTVEITVDSPPAVNKTPDDLVVCDSDNDGFAPFDLHTADADIMDGDTTLTVTYHGTPSDAQNNINELDNPYINDDPYNDVVFARVVGTSTTCYAVVPLKLEVRDSPMLTVPTPLRLCDDNTDERMIFDLTSKAGEILGALDATLYDIYYYVSELDAITAGDNAITAPDFSGAIGNPGAYPNISNPQTVYVLVVGNGVNTVPNNGETGCYDIVPLELIVDPLPVPVQALPYELCDDTLNGSTPTDQKSTFDLTSRESEITGGDLNLTVTWYETVADELADIQIGDPTAYQNREIPPAPLNPQTVIARVTNAFGCSVTTTLTLVVNPLPVAIEPTPLEVCDDDNDGIARFDLTLKNTEITNGEPGLILRYYTTKDLAEIGSPINQIFGLFTNNTPFNDFVFARVENGTTGCYAVVKLELIVNPKPDAPIAGFGDLTVCDPDGSGTAIFNLTLNADFIYGDQAEADFKLTYHRNVFDANSGDNPISNVTAFPSSGQTIYVRLENKITGCIRLSNFDLIIGEFPTIIDPVDMELCDDLESGSATDGVSVFDLTLNDLAITNFDPTLTVHYYATLADQQADIPIAVPTAYTNPVDGAGQGISPYTVYVSVFNGSGCSAKTTLTLKVNPIPQPVSPTPFVVCDADNDGFAKFNLTDKDDEIGNGQLGVVISYYETRTDAENGTNALTDPYQNIIAFLQPIFVRVAFAAPTAGTGCFTVVPLDLIVSPTPVVPIDLPDLVLCDDDGDGFTEFNLTVQEELIFGVQDQTDLLLTYYTSFAAADAGTGEIGNPTKFTNTTNPQTIWVRLANTVTGCYTVGEFDVVVSLGLTIIDPTPLEKCDDLGEPNDGKRIFDLREKNSEITNGVPSADVGYYLTEQNAIDDVDRIDPDTAYENISNPQLLYVRVTESNTGCLSYTTLLLRVLSNPEPVKPDNIDLCDIDNPLITGPDVGVELFDLTIREAQILNNSDWTLDYYESYANAVLQKDPIPDPKNYENTTSPQIIYVRATNPDTGCFEIVELQITVNPLPDDSADVSSIFICEVDTDGLAIFNLNDKTLEILGDQSPNDFSVSFYLDPNDAANNTNALQDANAHQNKDAAGNIENPQTIYTGITDNATQCYIGGEQSFDLIVQEDAIATQPAEPFIICDNLPPSDGIAEFNLEDLGNQAVVDLRSEILSGQDPATYSLEFYETLENAVAATGKISFPYTNIINPQVIYARVTSEADLYEPKCYAVVEVILKVEELPQVLLDSDYRLCVDVNGNPITEEDGSASPPVIDTGLDPGLYTFMWLLDGVIIPGETGSSIIALQGGDYEVIVTEIATGCDVSATATVTVSAPPTTYDAVILNGAFADNHIIEASADGLGDYVFQLDNGPFQESGIFENVSPGSHIITIRDANGCGSVTIEVNVIDYPAYFTPNQDGYHDTWNIIGIATGDPTAKIYIFDRFGKLLKQLSPVGRGWDGTYSGSPLPSSDYWFRVDYKEDGINKQFKGHFTLKR